MGCMRYNLSAIKRKAQKAILILVSIVTFTISFYQTKDEMSMKTNIR